MKRQKELITEISKKTGVSRVWMANQIEMSRQLFNTKVNKDQLTTDQIESLKLKTNYDYYVIK